MRKNLIDISSAEGNRFNKNNIMLWENLYIKTQFTRCLSIKWGKLLEEFVLLY